MIKNLIGKVQTASQIRREDGINELLVTVYRLYVRDLLPKTNSTVKKNNIPVIVSSVPILDSLLNIITEEPNYESNYISCMESIIHPGIDVVVVGGGWGVAATVAGQKVGTEGSVLVYEASESEVRKTKQTVKLNQTSTQTQVIHAIIGDPIKLRGNEDTQNAKNISLENLPAHDILLIDCDGCELFLLNNLSNLQQLPDKIVVEHHGIKDEVEYDPKSIKEKLRDYDYTIIESSIEKFPGLSREDPREIIIVAELA
jgi:hypothetical protein